MRRHDPDDATPSRIQPGGDDTEDDVLAGKDARNLGPRHTGATSSPGDGGPDGRIGAIVDPAYGTLHDAHGGGPAFFHETGSLLDAGPRADHGRGDPGVHHRGQIWEGHLVLERFGIGHHRRRLRIGGHSTELGLNAGERGGQLGRGRGGSFDLGERFVEDLGNVQQPDDIAVFVTNGLSTDESVNVGAIMIPSSYPGHAHQMPEMLLDHQLQRLSSARRIPGDHRVRGHDLGDQRRPRVKTFRSDLNDKGRSVRCNPIEFEIELAGTERFPGGLALKARSLAVKIPLNPSS